MAEDNSALIAMSGGVDSSAAAYLMLKEGCRCQGATMRLLRSDDGQNAADAEAVCRRLGIPFTTLDLTGEFEEAVIQKFIRVYQAGGTPNPCVDCNRRMKFSRLLEAAEAAGLRCVATGHYARIGRDPETGRLLLKKALDAGRDQSYFLYTLTQEQLAQARFPLGDMEKRQVRELAERLGFVNAHRKDSQDICFIPGGDYGAFIEAYTGKSLPSGDFLDSEGRVVGRHRGAARYTLGQRKGLGLSMGEPVYVCGKDMAANTVTVGPERALYAREILVEDLNWIALEGLSSPLGVSAKTRSRQREQPALICPESGGRVRLAFDRPQRAVTPGQAAVFYHGDAVVGGGTITEVLEEKEGRYEL
nr:tRNA 2-thiouridine(34) synthase MnmA [uncultured Oscillibacter sp.]